MATQRSKALRSRRRRSERWFVPRQTVFWVRWVSGRPSYISRLPVSMPMVKLGIPCRVSMPEEANNGKVRVRVLSHGRSLTVSTTDLYERREDAQNAAVVAVLVGEDLGSVIPG